MARARTPPKTTHAPSAQPPIFAATRVAPPPKKARGPGAGQARVFREGQRTRRAWLAAASRIRAEAASLADRAGEAGCGTAPAGATHAATRRMNFALGADIAISFP